MNRRGFNNYHQLAEAEREARREAECREREEVMAADPVMGEANAKRLLIEAREMAKVSDKGEVTLVVCSRGGVSCNRIVAKSLGGNSMRYSVDRENITRKVLFSMLEKSSHRSHVEI
jgi:hypothetical protein